jgi:hypothetical protein
VVGRLPASVSYAIAHVLGSLAYFCWPRGRRALLANYGRVLRAEGRAAQRRAARLSLVNYCKYLADFIRFPTA